MRVNPFVHLLIQMSDVIHSLPAHAHIELDETTAPEIVAIMRFDNTSLDNVTPRRLVIKTQADTIQFIPTTSGLWEPLAYPLFFPHGTLGWSSSHKCVYNFALTNCIFHSNNTDRQ